MLTFLLQGSLIKVKRVQQSSDLDTALKFVTINKDVMCDIVFLNRKNRHITERLIYPRKEKMLCPGVTSDNFMQIV